MDKKDKKVNNYERDNTDPLFLAAQKNKSFGKRFVEEARKAMEAANVKRS